MRAENGTPPIYSPGQWIFYYDGDCGLCHWLVRWLERIDLVHGIRWVPFQSLEVPPQGLDWSDLDRAAYLDSDSGNRYPGFYAFRRLTLKVALLWPLAPIFWLPGMQVPGKMVYRWVAENRYRLSRCAVPDDRAPQQRHPTPPSRDDD